MFNNDKWINGSKGKNYAQIESIIEELQSYEIRKFIIYFYFLSQIYYYIHSLSHKYGRFL